MSHKAVIYARVDPLPPDAIDKARAYVNTHCADEWRTDVLAALDLLEEP
jgi:hypothetical protein